MDLLRRIVSGSLGRDDPTPKERVLVLSARAVAAANTAAKSAAAAAAAANALQSRLPHSVPAPPPVSARPARSSAQRAFAIFQTVAQGHQIIITSPAGEAGNGLASRALASRRGRGLGMHGTTGSHKNSRQRGRKRSRRDSDQEDDDDNQHYHYRDDGGGGGGGGGSGGIYGAARKKLSARSTPRHASPPPPSSHATRRPRYRVKLTLPPLPSRRVRVWWPPTLEPNRTDYGGSWWTATVIDKDTSRGKFLIRYKNAADEDEWVYPDRISPLFPPTAYGEEIDYVPGEYVEVFNESEDDPGAWLGQVVKMVTKERIPTFLVSFPFCDGPPEEVRVSRLRRANVYQWEEGEWMFLKPDQVVDVGEVVGPMEMDTCSESELKALLKRKR